MVENKYGKIVMKVMNKKSVTTDTVIEVSREDLINALNASGEFNIPYNARVWVRCEKRNEYDIKDSGFINIRFKMTEEIPEHSDQPIPF